MDDAEEFIPPDDSKGNLRALATKSFADIIAAKARGTFKGRSTPGEIITTGETIIIRHAGIGQKYRSRPFIHHFHSLPSPGCVLAAFQKSKVDPISFKRRTSVNKLQSELNG